jgi:hypothetical protein
MEINKTLKELLKQHNQSNSYMKGNLKHNTRRSQPKEIPWI